MWGGAGIAMWFVGLIAGAFLGAVAGEIGAAAGAVIGGIAGIAWSLTRRKSAEARIGALEERLQGIESRLADIDAWLPTPHPPAARAGPAPAPGALASEHETEAAAEAGEPVAPEPALGPVIGPAQAAETQASAMDGAPGAGAEPAMEAAPERPVRQPSRLWQWLTGGNPFVRVGVVVLFFGVAFLLRYAAEHVRFPIELRLASVAAGAIVLLAIGWRLRLARPSYALVLQGAAVGVLYLTVFAAFRLYGLLPAALAFFLLIALALLSAVAAIAQDSRSLAVAGATGGFLAPVLASTGSGSHVMLFSYYLVLNAGIVAIAWFKAWRVLNVVGFAFTFVIGALWGARYYRPALFASTEPFLIAFFLFYVAIAVLFARRRSAAQRNYVDGTIVFGTPLVAFLLQARLVADFELGAAYSAAAASALYLVLAARLGRAGDSLRLLAESFLALGIVFATLTIPLAFDARVTAASWALEGAAIVWVSARQNRRLGQAFGALLQIASGVAFMLAEDLEPPRMAVLNSSYLGALMIALGGLYGARTLSRLAAATKDWRRVTGALLLLWGTLWWCGAGAMEIERFAAGAGDDHAILVFLLLTCLAFSLLRERLGWNEARFVAYAWLPVMYLGALVDCDEIAHPFAHAGYIAWPAAFALHFGLLRRHEDEGQPARAYHATGLWLLAALASWELGWGIGELARGGTVWRAIGWAVVPAAILWLVARAGSRIRWPLAANLRTYLLWGAAPIALFVYAWTLAVNFFASGDPAPLPYIPLLNPLDLAQIGAFLGVVAWIVALRTAGFGRRFAANTPLLAVLGGGAVFLWLNAALLRTLHHWAGVPLRFAALMDSMLVQACLSIFWTLIALCMMVFATRSAQRALWMAGAALMAVVTAKLFFVDLSNVGGIARIVSFMGVGLLLLVVGYFSPVPPKQAQ